MVEGNSLENCRTRNGIVSSNLTSSAKRNMQLNRASSSLLFALPVITGFFQQAYTYALLSISILIASYWFHRRQEYGHQEYLSLFQCADRLIAVLCYAYLYYFVSAYPVSHPMILYVLLTGTLIVYTIGKLKQDNTQLHVWFHVLIAAVSGIIPLFLAR